MLDTVIGPIIRVIDSHSFQMQVTHIGTHNLNPYSNYETIYIAENLNAVNPTPLSILLLNKRVRCLVRYRDNYNRLICDVEFDNS